MGRRLLVHILVWTLCLGLSPAEAAVIATARAVSGDVQFRPVKAKPYQPLVSGTTLAAGGWVRTGAGGWAELQLADGSRLTLANRTELELASLRIDPRKKEGIFSLAEGKLRASITKLAGQQTDYRIRSRTVVAGVKGTEFLMLSRGEANVLFGTEGNVAVAGSAKEREIKPLLSGTMVQNTRGSVPTDPVAVESGSPLAEARELFSAATGSAPPTEWEGIDRLPDLLARWNVNYGHYQTDRGEYEQALTVFQIAIDLTLVPEIRADARLERGTVQGRFLNNPRAALAEYLLVLEEYPRLPQAETALFSAGQTLFTLGLNDKAAARFRQYLQLYPAGRYRSTVETLLRQVEEPGR